MNATQFVCDFNSLSRYLRAFAFKLTKDIHLAEDLFQDTALRAFDNRDKFSASTNMKAWLSTIMKNTFINHFRRKQRWDRILVTTDDEYIIHSEKKSTWNEGERKLTMEALEQSIDNLGDPMRIPFLMICQGYKYEEIALYMDLPIGTVKSRIFQARKILKDRIKHLYDSREKLAG